MAPPCRLPHRRYQAQKPRKGELGLFLFCCQALPVSKLGAAAPLTPPWRPPRRPDPRILSRSALGILCPPPARCGPSRLAHLHLGRGGPSPSPQSTLGPSAGPSQSSSPGASPRAEGPAPCPRLSQARLTVRQPAAPTLTPAPQVAQGSEAGSLQPVTPAPQGPQPHLRQRDELDPPNGGGGGGGGRRSRSPRLAG